MININNISKTFKVKNKEFKALDNVSLSIEKNTIHGIIGPSGAGKSTLIRVINQLETHNQGTVSVFDYRDLRKLNKESTRMYRKKVSMIFQRFNLLERKTVFENIALPITFSRRLTEEDKQKIQELINLVELNGYEESLPSQLSGGQQQRVGIARALINDPEILLCDEPTSALDPLTISSILNLIKKIQKDLSLTVIVVTHDMNVIKDICEYVTVMSGGQIIEQNTMDNIIFNPQTDLTKKLLGSVGYDLQETISHYPDHKNLYLLKFSEESKQETIISKVSIEHNMFINILYANITPGDQGIMLVSFQDQKVEDIQAITSSLKEKGVNVRHVS